MSKKGPTVRIGLVGAGHMNNTYARCLLHYNKNAELVAVAGGSRMPDFAVEYEPGGQRPPTLGSSRTVVARRVEQGRIESD